MNGKHDDPDVQELRRGGHLAVIVGRIASSKNRPRPVIHDTGAYVWVWATSDDTASFIHPVDDDRGPFANPWNGSYLVSIPVRHCRFFSMKEAVDIEDLIDRDEEIVTNAY